MKRAAPHGYKCSCATAIERPTIFTPPFPVCIGTPVKCDSPDDEGCYHPYNDGGCTDKECCLGVCDGYRFDGGMWFQNIFQG